MSIAHWPALLAALVSRAPRAAGGAGRRERRTKRSPKPITPYDCMKLLAKHGWTFVGAGANYGCVYLNHGDLRVVLLVSLRDPITPNGLREMAADFKQAEYAEGRHCVAVYQQETEYGIVEQAAHMGITLIRFDVLATLEDAIADSEAAAAAGRAAELRALTRAYDPPEAAPIRVAAAPASGPVLETEAVACFLRDRGGDDLLISFANQWLRHDGRAFWADAVSASLGISVVGLVAKEPNWYPPDDMAAILPALSNLLQGRFPRRILYGHSQGGYAAIKFSRALGATTVLAFSPQYSIDRRLIADERVNKYYTGQRHAGMWPEPRDTAGSIFLFYDPYDAADTAHANRIGEALPVLPVKIPFVGHASDRGLGDPDRFARLLAAARDSDAAGMRRFVARERAVRVERSVLMALRLADKRPRTAAAILQKHGGGWKTDQVGSVCFRLALAGQAKLAFEPALAAAEAALTNANAQGTAGLIAIESRQLDIAQKLIDRALELEPFSPKWLNAAQRIRNLHMAAPALATH